MGAILYMMRRWSFPRGSLIFIITIPYTFMFVMVMQDSFDVPFTLPAMILTSVVAELLYQTLQPTMNKLTSVRQFAFLVPFVMVGFYVTTLLVTHGLWWGIHMWAGIPVLSRVVGLLMSYLIHPEMAKNLTN